MKKIIVCILLASFVGIALVYAAATTETKDKAAVPQTIYGKTADGTLKAIIVDEDGKLQLSS